MLRSHEQRTSHEAHQLSLGVFSLLSSLAGGQPLGGALSFLQGAAAQDPVVQAALAAVSSQGDEGWTACAARRAACRWCPVGCTLQLSRHRTTGRPLPTSPPASLINHALLPLPGAS